ncbi:hypothetical protein [Arachidicoccus soli]|nr:hypothetical protein [Arachidicoccus soli]
MNWQILPNGHGTYLEILEGLPNGEGTIKYVVKLIEEFLDNAE